MSKVCADNILSTKSHVDKFDYLVWMLTRAHLESDCYSCKLLGNDMVQIMMNKSYVNIPRHDVLREPRDTRHGDLQIWIFGSDNMHAGPTNQ
jgi:hypothetical protein